MSARLTSAVFVLTVLAAVSVALAFQSAGLSGVVVDDLGRPVRLAAISLESAAIPHALSAVSDDDGRFAFAELPEGTYTLSAAKGAYISNAYGATRPGGRGTRVVLAEGQRVGGLRLELQRGAVITGVISSPDGTPLTGVEVAALPADAVRVHGEYLLQPATVRTDDRGAYRMFGLAPGAYVVIASIRTAGSGDSEAPDAALLDARFEALRRREAGGGSARVVPGGAASPARRPATVDFAETYYPGTVHVEGPADIALAAGEERAGVDFSIALVPTAGIEGTVVTADGSPLPRVHVGLGRAGPHLSFLSSQLFAGDVDAEGRFSYRSLPPGRYTLTARAPSGPNRSASPARYASATVTLDGDDVTGLLLPLTPGRRFAGQVAFDPAPPDLPTRRRLSALLVMESYVAAARASGRAIAITPTISPSSTIRFDERGAFDAGDLEPGQYLLVGRAAADSGWWLRSAMSGGRDLLDTGVPLDDTDLTDVVLTYTTRRSALVGAIESFDETPAPGCFVVVVPVDRSLWRPRARRILSTRPDSTGAFAFSNLPAGDYHLAAVLDMDRDDLARTEFLDAVASSSIRVTVRDGETTVQRVRMSGG
jgi:hypothetical protein